MAMGLRKIRYFFTLLMSFLLLGFLSEGARAENYINENMVGAVELSSHFFTAPDFDDTAQVFTIPAGELWEIVFADGKQDLKAGNDEITNAGVFNLGTPGSPATPGAIEFGAGTDRFINLKGATFTMLRGAEFSMGGGNDFFTNYGTITTSGLIHGRGSTNRLENYGSFTASEAGSLEKWTSIDNYGSFSTAGLFSFADVGTFTNKAGGTFTLNANLDFDSDGTADSGNFVNEGTFVIASGQKTISNILSFTNNNGVINFTLDFTSSTTATTARLILTGSGFTGFTLNGGSIEVSNPGATTSSGTTFHLIEIPLAVASVTETKLPHLDPVDAAGMGYSLAEIAVIGKSGDTSKSVLIIRAGTAPTAGGAGDDTITIESHQTYNTGTDFSLGNGVNIFNLDGGLYLSGAGIVGGTGVDTFNINAGAHALLAAVGSTAAKFDGGLGNNILNNAGTITIHHASSFANISSINNNATGVINVNSTLTFSNTDFMTNAGTINLNATWDLNQTIRLTNTGNIVVGAGAQRSLLTVANFTSSGKFTFSLDFDAPSTARLLLTAYTTFALTGGEVIIANADAITTPDADAVYRLIHIHIRLTQGVTALTVSEETATALGFGIGQIAIINDPDHATRSFIVLRNNPVFTAPATGTTGSDNVNIKSGLTWTLASDLDLLAGTDSITNDKGTITTSAAVTLSNVETVNNAGVFNVNNALTFSAINAFNNNAGGTLTLSANIDFGSTGTRAFSNAGALIVAGTTQKTLTNAVSFTSSGAMTFTLDFATTNAHNTARLKLTGTNSFTISGGTVTITNATTTARGSGAADLTYRLIEIPLAFDSASVMFTAPTVANAAAVTTGLGYTSSAEIGLVAGTTGISYIVLRPLSTAFTPPSNPGSGVETVDVLSGQEWTISSGYDLEASGDTINNEGTINVAEWLNMGSGGDRFNNKATGIINISATYGEIYGGVDSDTFTNEGTINILASAAASHIGSFETFINSGAINADITLRIAEINTFTNQASGTLSLKGGLTFETSGTRSLINAGTIALSAGQKVFTDVKIFTSTGVLSLTLDATGSGAGTANLKLVGVTTFSIDGGTITVSNAAAVTSAHGRRATFTLIEIPIAYTITTAPTLDAETQAIMGYLNPQFLVKAGTGADDGKNFIVLQESIMAQPTFSNTNDDELTIPLGQTWDTEFNAPSTGGGDDTIIIKGGLAVEVSELGLGTGDDTIITEETGIFSLHTFIDGDTGDDKLINWGRVQTAEFDNKPEFRNFETIENYGTFSADDGLIFNNFDTFTNMASGNLILQDDIEFKGSGLLSLDSKGRITAGPEAVEIDGIKVFSSSGLFTFALDYSSASTALIQFTGTALTDFTITPGGIVTISNFADHTTDNGTYTLMEIPLPLASVDFSAPILDIANTIGLSALFNGKVEIAAIAKTGAETTTTLIVLRPNTFTATSPTTGVDEVTIPKGKTWHITTNTRYIGGADTITNHGTLFVANRLRLGQTGVDDDILTNSPTGFFIMAGSVYGGAGDDLFDNQGVFLAPSGISRIPIFTEFETVNNSGRFTINNAAFSFTGIGTFNNQVGGIFDLNVDTTNTMTAFVNTGSFIVKEGRIFGGVTSFTSSGDDSSLTFTLDFANPTIARLQLTGTSSFTISGGTVIITNAGDRGALAPDATVYRLIEIPALHADIAGAFVAPAIANIGALQTALGFASTAQIALVPGTGTQSFLVLQQTPIFTLTTTLDTTANTITVSLGEQWTITTEIEMLAGADEVSNSGIIFITAAGALDLGDDDDTITNNQFAVIDLSGDIEGGAGANTIANAGTINITANTAGLNNITTINNTGVFNVDNPFTANVTTFNNNSGGVVNVEEKLTFSGIANFNNNAGSTLNLNADIDFGATGTRILTSAGSITVAGGAPRTLTNVKSFTSTGTMTFTLDFTTPRTALLNFVGTTSFALTGGEIIIANHGDRSTQAADAEIYVLMAVPMPSGEVVLTTAPSVAGATASSLGYTAAQIAVIDDPHNPGHSLIVLRQNPATAIPFTPSGSTFTVPVGQTWAIGSAYTLQTGTITVRGIMTVGANVIGGAGSSNIIIELGGVLNLNVSSGTVSGSTGTDSITNKGVINTTGRELANFQTLTNEATGIINVNSGTLNLSATGLPSASSFSNAGVLNLNGGFSTVTSFTNTGRIAVMGGQRTINAGSFSSTGGTFVFTLDFTTSGAKDIARLKLTGGNSFTFALSGGTVIITNAEDITTPDADAIYRLIEIPLAIATVEAGFTAPSIADLAALQTALGYSSAAIALESGGANQTFIVLQETPFFVPDSSDKSANADTITVPAGQEWNISDTQELLAGADEVMNDGTIVITATGILNLGDDDDTITNNGTGAINLAGDIEGGSGDDVITNAGAITITAATADIKNVKTINNTGEFNVENLVTFTNLDAFNNNVGGTLTLGANMDFGATGTRTLTNLGTIAVSGARTLTNVQTFTNETGTFSFVLDFAAPAVARLTITSATAVTITGGTVLIPNAEAITTADASAVYHLIKVNLVTTIAGLTLDPADATALGYTDAEFFTMSDGSGGTIIALRENPLFTPPSPSGITPITYSVPAGKVWNTGGFLMGGGADIINNLGTITINGVFQTSGGDDRFNNKDGGIINVQNSLNMGSGDDILNNEAGGIIHVLGNNLFLNVDRIENRGIFNITNNMNYHTVGDEEIHNELSGVLNLNANINYPTTAGTSAFNNKGKLVITGQRTISNAVSFISTGTITFTLNFAAPTNVPLTMSGTITSFQLDGGTITIANAEQFGSNVAGQTYTLISIPMASITFTSAPTVDAADAALLGFSGGAIVTTMQSGGSTLVILTQNPAITPPAGTNAVNDIIVGSGQTWTLSTAFDLAGEADSVTNSGTITIGAAGNLQGGAGGDTITNEASGIISLSGDIDLGADGDTITNRGTITIAAATADIKNVETINNTGTGADFNVNNALTLTGLTIFNNVSGGTLTLGANIDFGTSGTRSLNNAGGSLIVTGAPRTLTNIARFTTTGKMTFSLGFGAAATTARLVLTGTINTFTINGGEVIIANAGDITTPSATAVYHLINIPLALATAQVGFNSPSIASGTATSLGFSNAHIVLITDPDDPTKSVLVLKQNPAFQPPPSTTGDDAFTVGVGVEWNIPAGGAVYSLLDGDDHITNEGTVKIYTTLSLGEGDDMFTNAVGATVFVSSTFDGWSGEDTLINRGTITTDSSGSTDIGFETVRNFGTITLNRQNMDFETINQFVNEAGGIVNLNVSVIEFVGGSRTFSNAGSIIVAPNGRRGFHGVRTFTSSGIISLELDFNNISTARFYLGNDIYTDDILTSFALDGEIVIRNASSSTIAARVYVLMDVPLPLADVSISNTLTIADATATSLGYSDYQIVAIPDPNNPGRTLIVLRQNPATAIAYTATLTASAVTIPVGYTWTTSNGTDTLGAGADSFTVYGTANINGVFGGGTDDDSFIIERGGVINLGNFAFNGDGGTDSLTNKAGGVINAAGGTFSFETISNSGIFNANSGTTDLGSATFTNAGIFNLKNTLNIGGSFTNTGTFALSAGQKSVTGAGSFTSSGILIFALDTTGSGAGTANLKFTAITAFTLNGGTIIVSNPAGVLETYDPRGTFTLIEIPLASNAATFIATNLPTLDPETQRALRYYNPQIVVEAGSGNITYIRLKENKMTAPTLTGNADDITVPLGQTWDTDTEPELSGGDDTITVEGALTVFRTMYLGIGNDTITIEKSGVFALDDILDGEGGDDKLINRGRVETRRGLNNNPTFTDIKTIENYGSFTVLEARTTATDALVFKNFDTFTNMAGGNLVLYDDLEFTGTGLHRLTSQGRITVGAKPVRVRNAKLFSSSGLFTFALDFANPNTARLAFTGTALTSFTIAPGGIISISNAVQRFILGGTYTLMEIPLALASLNFTAPRLDYDNYPALGYTRAEIVAIPKDGDPSKTLIVLRPNTFAITPGTTGVDEVTIPKGATLMQNYDTFQLGDGVDTVTNHGTFLASSTVGLGPGDDFFINSPTGYLTIEGLFGGGSGDDDFTNRGTVDVLAGSESRHGIGPYMSGFETVNNSGSFTISHSSFTFRNIGTVTNQAGGIFTLNVNTDFSNIGANTPSLFVNQGSFVVSGSRTFGAKGFSSSGAGSGFTFTLDFTANAHNTPRLQLTGISSFTLSGGTIIITNSGDRGSAPAGQVYRLIEIPLLTSITFAPPSVADASQVASDLGYTNGAEIARIAGTGSDSSKTFIVLREATIITYTPPAVTGVAQTFTIPAGSTWIIGGSGFDTGAGVDTVDNSGIINVNAELGLGVGDDIFNNLAGGIINLNHVILGGAGTDKVFNRGTLHTLAGSASNVNASFKTVEEVRNAGIVNIDHQLDLEDFGTFYNQIAGASGGAGIINLDADLNFINSGSFASAFDNEGGTLNVTGTAQRTMAGVKSFASSATGTITFTLNYGAPTVARLKLTGTTSFTISGGTITITNATTAARGGVAAGLTYRLIEIPATASTFTFTLPTLTAAGDVKTGLGYTNDAELAVEGTAGAIRYIVLREFDPSFNPSIPSGAATVTVPAGRIWNRTSTLLMGGDTDTINVEGTFIINAYISLGNLNDYLNVRSTGIVELRSELDGSNQNDTINNAGTFNVLDHGSNSSPTDLVKFEAFNNTGTVNLSVNFALKDFGTFNNNAEGILNLSRNIVFSNTQGTTTDNVLNNNVGGTINVSAGQKQLINNKIFTSAGTITFTLDYGAPTVARLKLTGTTSFALSGGFITITNAVGRTAAGAADGLTYRLIEIPMISTALIFTAPTLTDAATVTTQLGYARLAQIAIEAISNNLSYIVLQETPAPVEFTPPAQTNDPEVFTVPVGQIWNVSAADINFDGGIDIISNSGTINITKNLRGGSGNDMFNNLDGGTIDLDGGSIDGDAGTADIINNAGTFTVSSASQIKDTENIVNQATGAFYVNNALTIIDELELFDNQEGGVLYVNADIGFGSNKARAFSNSGTLAVGTGGRTFTNALSFASTSTGTMTFALDFAAPTTARLKLTGTTSFTLGGGFITITNSGGRSTAGAAIGLTYYLIEIPLVSTSAGILFAAPTLSNAVTVAGNLGYTRAAEIDIIAGTGSDTNKTFIVLKEVDAPPPAGFTPPAGDNTAETVTINSGETWNVSAAFNLMGGVDIINNSGTLTIGAALSLGGGNDQINNLRGGIMNVSNWINTTSGADSIDNNEGGMVNSNSGARYVGFSTITNSGIWNIKSSTRFQGMGTFTNQASGIFNMNSNSLFSTSGARAFVNLGRLNAQRAGVSMFGLLSFRSTGGTISLVLSGSGSSTTAPFTLSANGLGSLTSFELSGGTIIIDASARTGNNGATLTLIDIELALGSVSFTAPTISGASALATALGYTNMEIEAITDPDDASKTLIVLREMVVTAPVVFTPTIPNNGIGVNNITVPFNNVWTVSGQTYLGSGADTLTNSGTIHINNFLSLGSGDDTFTNKGIINIGGGSGELDASSQDSSDTLINEGTINILSSSRSIDQINDFEVITNSGTFTVNAPLEFQDMGTFTNSGDMNINANVRFSGSTTRALVNTGAITFGGQTTFTNLISFNSSSTGSLSFALDFTSGAHNTARLLLTGTTSFTLSGGTITITNADARGSGAVGLTYRLIEIPILNTDSTNFVLTLPTLTDAATVASDLGYTGAAQIALIAGNGNQSFIVLQQAPLTAFTPPPSGGSGVNNIFTVTAGTLWSIGESDYFTGSGTDTINNEGTITIEGTNSVASLNLGSDNDALNNKDSGIINIGAWGKLDASNHTDTLNNEGIININAALAGVFITEQIKDFEAINNSSRFNVNANLVVKGVNVFTNSGNMNINANVSFTNTSTNNVSNTRSLVNTGTITFGEGQKTFTNVLVFNSSGTLTFTLDYTAPTVARLRLTGTTSFTLASGGVINITNPGDRSIAGASYTLISIALPLGTVSATFTAPTISDAIAAALGYTAYEIVALADGSNTIIVLRQSPGTPFTPTAPTTSAATIAVPISNLWTIATAFNAMAGADIINNDGTIDANNLLSMGEDGDTLTNKADGIINIGGASGQLDGGTGTDSFSNAGTLNILPTATQSSPISAFETITNTGTIAIGGTEQKTFAGVTSFTSSGTLTFTLNFAAPTTARLKLTGTNSFTLSGGTITITNSGDRGSNDAVGVTYALIEIPIVSTDTTNLRFTVPTLSDAAKVASDLGYTLAAQIALEAGSGSITYLVLREMPAPAIYTPPGAQATIDNLAIGGTQTWTLSTTYDLLAGDDRVTNAGTIIIEAAGILQGGAGNETINNAGGTITLSGEIDAGVGTTDTINNAGTIDIAAASAKISNVETLNNTGAFNVNNPLTLAGFGTFTNAGTGTLTLGANINFGSSGARALTNAGTLIIGAGQKVLTNIQSFTSTGGIIQFTLDFTNPTVARLKLSGSVASVSISGGSITIPNAASRTTAGIAYTLMEIETAIANVAFTAPNISSTIVTALGYSLAEIVAISDPNDANRTLIILRENTSDQPFTAPAVSSGIDAVVVPIRRIWTISSEYDLGTGADTITNSGTIHINAALKLGAGDDVLTNNSGGTINLSNTINAEGGSDRINNSGIFNITNAAAKIEGVGNFRNSKTLNINNALAFDNFGTLNNQTGAVIYLNANLTFAVNDANDINAFTHSGSLVIGAGQKTLTNLKTFTSSGKITFNLDFANPLTPHLVFTGTTSFSVVDSEISIANISGKLTNGDTYYLMEIPLALGSITTFTATHIDAEMAALGYTDVQIIAITDPNDASKTIIVMRQNPSTELPTYTPATPTGNADTYTITSADRWTINANPFDTAGGDDIINNSGTIDISNTLRLGSGDDTLNNGGTVNLFNSLQGSADSDTIENAGTFNILSPNARIASIETFNNTGTFNVNNLVTFSNFGTLNNKVGGTMSLNANMDFGSGGVRAFINGGTITVTSGEKTISNVASFSSSGTITLNLDFSTPTNTALVLEGISDFSLGGTINIGNVASKTSNSGTLTYYLFELPASLANIDITANINSAHLTSLGIAQQEIGIITESDGKQYIYLRDNPGSPTTATTGSDVATVTAGWTVSDDFDFMGGNDRLTNSDGSLVNIEAALSFGAGDDSIVNEGTITLSDALTFGIGDDVFTNSGIINLESGSAIDFSTGFDSFTSDGTIVVKAKMEIMGLERFTSTGTITFTIDFADVTNAQLIFSGSTIISLADGSIDLTLPPPIDIPAHSATLAYYLIELTGDSIINILQARGGPSHSFSNQENAPFNNADAITVTEADLDALKITDPEFVIIENEAENKKYIALQQNPNTPLKFAGALPDSLRGFADYLDMELPASNAIYAMLNLDLSSGEAALHKSVRSLVPDIYASLIGGSISAIEDIESHAKAANCGAYSLFDEYEDTKCIWQQAIVREDKFAAKPGRSGTDIESTSISGGIYLPLLKSEKDAKFTSMVVYEESEVTSEDSSSNGIKAALAFGLSHKISNKSNPARLKTQLMIGFGEDDVSRSADIATGQISSVFKQSFVSLKLTLENIARFSEKWQFVQRAGANFTYLKADGVKEEGNNEVVLLDIAGFSKSYYNVETSFALNGKFGETNIFMPYIEIGVLYYPQDPSTTLNARFSSLDDKGFTFKEARDDLVVHTQIGANFFSGDRSRFNINYRRKAAQDEALDTESFSISLKLQF